MAHVADNPCQFRRLPRWFRALTACAVVVAGLIATGVAFAANQSVQGAKKDEGGYDTDAPTAILIDADSGSADVASLNATSEMSSSRRASVDQRVLFNPREVSYDAPIDDPVSQPASPMSRPVSAYAPTNLGASPDPMAGRGLY